VLVRSGYDRRTGRLRFLAWGWAMIAVVLLSSAPTSAQPRSTLAGSAFDPASTAVVISPKRMRADAAVRKAVPTPPPEKVLSGPGDIAVAPPLASRLPQATPQWDYVPPPDDDAAPIFGASRARAPPFS